MSWQINNTIFHFSFHIIYSLLQGDDPLGNVPNLCHVTSYCIFHLATADRCDKITRSWATSLTGPTEAIPTAAQKKKCKLFHTQVKLFQVNLHLKFSLQRHLYFSMYHRVVPSWFYLRSKQHFTLEIIQRWKEVQRLRNLLISEMVMWKESNVNYRN